MDARDEDEYIDEFVDSFHLMRLQLAVLVMLFETEPMLVQAKSKIEAAGELMETIPKTLARTEKFIKKENT